MNDSTLRHTNAARAIVSAHYQTARVKDVYKSERHLALASDGDTQPGIRIGVRPALPFGGCSCSLGLEACTCALSALAYDASTGDLTWTRKPHPRSSRVEPGMVAGCTNSRGYKVIGLGRVVYYAHRLAWLLFHGRWPLQQIDHINGDKADNRIANLREVDSATNNQNKHSARGVTLTPGREKPWQAGIKVNGKSVYLGRYATEEEARGAYLEAKRRLHPGSAV